MPQEFRTYRELRDAYATAVQEGKEQEFNDSLPEIRLADGRTLTPMAVYINGDNFAESADDVRKAGSISLVYSAGTAGDVRIQVNKNNTAYVSGWLGGRGVPGSTVDINPTGVLSTFEQELKNNRNLSRALELSALGVSLDGVTLASNSASNAGLPSTSGIRQL